MTQRTGSPLARLQAAALPGPDVPLHVAGTPGNDNLTGDGTAETISGGEGNDVIRGLGGGDSLNGGALSDQLYGGDQNDIVNGGAGGDLLFGEADDDTLWGVDGNDKLFGGDGIDTLDGGTGADRLDGGAGTDILYGRGDNDLLDGGAGADTMTGGLGNDVYVIDDLADQTIEVAGQGYEIVRASLGGLTLQVNIEGLEFLGTGDFYGIGNDLANNIQGNVGRNSLYGAGGVDTINGGDGDDLIDGGASGDLLRGGAGADRFRVSHELYRALETDIIYDFNLAEGDILDFGAVDADFRTFGDQSFVLVSELTGAGQMTLELIGDRTLLRLNVSGGGGYGYQMWINGDVTGASGDWIL